MPSTTFSACLELCSLKEALWPEELSVDCWSASLPLCGCFSALSLPPVAVLAPLNSRCAAANNWRGSGQDVSHSRRWRTNDLSIVPA